MSYGFLTLSYGVYMGCNKITVRFDGQLYDKVRHHELSNSDLIRKAVRQYFRSVEPNNRLNMDGPTMSYDQDLIKLYQDQVQDLKLTNSHLLDMVQEKDRIIGMQSLGMFGKLKYLLQAKK